MLNFKIEYTMTYAEVKAKYTTVESIDNRLNEIDELTKVGAEKYKSAITNYINDLNEALKKFNVNSYHVNTASDRSVSFVLEDNRTFYEVNIYPSYKINWDNIDAPKKIWEFSLEVGSYGEISLSNPSENDVKVLKYYDFIGMIISNKEFQKEIEDVCHKNVDNLNAIDKEFHFTSEEQQLRILRNNLIKEAAYGKIISSVMDAKDKTQLVVIKKNVSEDEADGVRKGEFIKVMTEPLPNTPETRPEVDKKLKEIAKTNEGKFILTQIRFIKLNEE